MFTVRFSGVINKNSKIGNINIWEDDTYLSKSHQQYLKCAILVN